MTTVTATTDSGAATTGASTRAMFAFVPARDALETPLCVFPLETVACGCGALHGKCHPVSVLTRPENL